MFIPRFYQTDCLNAVARTRQNGITIALAVMASGLGKTVTVAFDILAFRKDFPKARILYLCHQNHILHQARGTIEAINGSNNSYGFFTGLEKAVHSVDFLFASLQTMRKHLKSFNPSEFDYVVVDESHHTHAGTFLDVVTYWKPKFLFGVTATPDRTDGQDIRSVFGKEVFYLPLEEALAQGLLTPVDYRLMTDEIQLQQAIDNAERRLSIRMLNRTIFVPKRDEEILRLIKEHSKEIHNPKTIIFCQSVSHCKYLAKLIPNAMSIHSRVSHGERIVRVGLFQEGLLNTLLVVDVFNEGIDIPEANVIVFLRSTTSHIVLFQQLGRGLRLSEGKKKVLVLDFVGNCERVKTIYGLWEDVKKRRQKFLGTISAKVIKERKILPSNTDPFYLDTSVPHFEEKILSVIDIVRRVSDGYTPEELKSKMQAFAKKLGRTPTQKEVQESKIEMPSLSAYNRSFGNFSKALQAAGLVPNQFKNVSDEELLLQLKKLQEKLGRTPTQYDISKASKEGECCSDPVFRDRFGSLTKAFELIGVKPTKFVGLTREELCDQLRELKVKLGRLPVVADIIRASAKDEMASMTLIWQNFGTFNQALRTAGLTKKVKEQPKYTKEQLLDDIRTARDLLGKVPTTGDMDRLRAEGKLKVGSLGPYYKKFATFGDAVNAAGVK